MLINRTKGKDPVCERLWCYGCLLYTSGSWKKKSFTHNLMSTAHIFSENEDPTHPVSDLTDDTSETWFQPESSELPVEITICLDGSYNLGYLVLKEAV